MRAWLAAPTEVSMQIFDEAQLKLFLSELTTPAAIRALAEQQVRHYQARLTALDALTGRFADRPSRMQAVPFGRAIYRAGLAFWNEIMSNGARPRR